MEMLSLGSGDWNLDAAVDDLRAGRMVVLEDRGVSPAGYHLAAAAQNVTEGSIATMLRDAVGMPMLMLPAARCEALGLGRLGDEPSKREMLTTFEARSGVSTGISAADRALTMRVAADPASTSADIVTPGHVVPIRVHPGSLLTLGPRAEAASVELAGLAGFSGGAALCQIMDESGRPAGRAGAIAVAERLGLRTVDTLEVLRRHLEASPLVARESERELSTPVGTVHSVTYREPRSGRLHFALTKELPLRSPIAEALVRTQDPARDVFGSPADNPLHDFLSQVVSRDDTILLYLAPLYPLERPDRDHGDPAEVMIRAQVTSQILHDLGIVAVTRSGPEVGGV